MIYLTCPCLPGVEVLESGYLNYRCASAALLCHQYFSSSTLGLQNLILPEIPNPLSRSIAVCSIALAQCNYLGKIVHEIGHGSPFSASLEVDWRRISIPDKLLGRVKLRLSSGKLSFSP